MTNESPAQQVLEALEKITAIEPESEGLSGDVSCIHCSAFRPYEDHATDCAWMQAKAAISAAQKLVEMGAGQSGPLETSPGIHDRAFVAIEKELRSGPRVSPVAKAAYILTALRNAGLCVVEKKAKAGGFNGL